MSQKALDRKGRWRNITVAFRVSPEERDAIDQMVRISGLTKQAYICTRLLQKDVVVQKNPRVYKALLMEIKQIQTELKRISQAGEVSEELQETIRMVAEICGGMKEGTHGTEEIFPSGQ